MVAARAYFLPRDHDVAKFAFLEISYDTSITSDEEFSVYMTQFGFVLRSIHAMEQTGFWTHGQAIFLSRKTNIGTQPTITGLGLIGTVADITNINAVFDVTTDFFVADNGKGFKTYIIQENQLDKNVVGTYNIIDLKTKSDDAIKQFSGIILNSNSNMVRDHYQALGFRMTKNSDNYDTLVSEVNNFSLLLCKKDREIQVPTIIADTDDIFKSTAYFVSKNCDIPTFQEPPAEGFGKLTFKINGYNCRAWGNENSYTIENFIKDFCGRIDFIVRQRRKYLHILEHTVDSYYEPTSI